MQDKYQEITVTIVAGMGLFLLIALILVGFILQYQKRKFQHTEQMRFMQEEAKQQFLTTKLEVQEQTRIYIGRELHDNIGTLSSLIKINLNLAETTDSEEKKKEWLAESKEMVKKLITEVKQLSLDLNTDRLADSSLPNILQKDIQRIEKLNLFAVQFITEGEEWPLDADKKIILYRICQELLHNILKHARPTQVVVAMNYTPEQLQIRITDDGIGFEKAAVSPDRKEGPGSGLTNMQNRITMIGGEITIDSRKGYGTKCYIQVPFS